MIRNLAMLLAGLSVAAAMQTTQAQERVARTGSRLDSDSSSRLVYQFSAGAEVQRVLDLLEQGRTDDAVEYARDYVDSLSSKAYVGGTSILRERYFALNALCAALTKAGRPDEAVATCSEAIERQPSEWTAFNSRGTAHYSSRRFDLAAADYLRALELAPSDEDVRAMIEHNLALTEQRIADQRP